MKSSDTLSMLVVAACVWLFSMVVGGGGVDAQTTTSSCVQEFEQCSMPRDCCEGLSCVGGDWEYTTDSTCLSPKSEQLEGLRLTKTQQIQLVQDFYVKGNVVKTDAQVEDIVRRFQPFSKLVLSLERKYDRPMRLPDEYSTTTSIQDDGEL